MAERQVRRSYREALVQISPTTEKKREKGNRGALERVVGEWEGKKGKRRVEKDKKRQKLKSSFINAVSIHYWLYMQYSREFTIVLEDNKADA